ncbi:hypothetical protein [Devosia sp.]|uniref:hypothetical protein n=1 Tax=Devosia sp. TaxID=1871048 RepID=UPI003F72BD7F
MRNRDLLRCAGALALGMLAAVSYSSSASAFSGLSDKQKSHIEVNIHCNILLWTDLKAFEADPACGGTVVETRSILPTGSGGAKRYEPPPQECEYPTQRIVSECPQPT